jgi:diguanylate cyclase (GGDEF) domain
MNVSVSNICQIIDLLNTSTDDCLYVYDLVNDFYYISEHALDRYRLPSHSFHNVTKNLGLIVHKDDLEALVNDLDEVLDGKKDFHNMQYRWLDKNGQPVWINCRGLIVRENNQALYMVGCINEIGVKPKADNISGLLRESSLQSYINQLDKAPLGYILRLGMDDFRFINEKLGIEYGDNILKESARIIAKCLENQMLYKMISDEFIIVDFHHTKKEGLRLYNNIKQKINELVEEKQYEAIFTISGGLLECSAIQDFSYSNIMKLTEFALNEAKQQGKNRIYVFDQSDYDQFLKKNQLISLLRKSINNGFEGFEAYYQPIVMESTKELFGAETLMRFNCDEFGSIPPNVFIPILEETGLIIPAGKWILNQAVKGCKQFQEFIPNFHISVNVSYMQLLKADLLDLVEETLEKHQLDPSYLIIELTESGILESSEVVGKIWKELKKSNVKIALDDFGTGYSNFHYLSSLKPDIIKIDRDFTVKAIGNKFEYDMLSLLSDMVYSLRLKVCIEGIEDISEYTTIKNIIHDFIQGFYFGHPCNYTQFVRKCIKEGNYE